MKLSKKFFMIIFASIFIGCSQLQPTITNKTGTNPPLNVKVRKNVGDVIFDQFNYSLIKNAHLKNNYKDKFGLGKIVINKNDILIYYSNGKESKYCSVKKAYLDPIVGPYSNVCFSGIDEKNKIFTKISVPLIMFGKSFPLKQPLKYVDAVIPYNSEGYRYQLIYDGIDNNTLKITYREFINNLARPAFYQTVSYKIKKNHYTQIIRFKSVKIIIYNANNQYIEYKIVSPFKENIY
jgi:hypothetical protein